MSRFTAYVVGISIWAFAVLMLMANTAHPEIALVGPGITLLLSIALAAWVIDLMVDADDPKMFRMTQATYAGVPFVWALWVANNNDVALIGTDWLYLASVSVLSVAVQQIALWERDAQTEAVTYDVMEAVRPILAPPAVLDTGSMRITR